MRLDDWEGAPVAAAADGPPSPSAWTPVDLPGRPAQFADEDAVAYRTTFADPRAAGERAVLELQGVYANADLWLNGEHVGEHRAYFAPVRVAVDLEGENELLVVCRRPARFGGIYETPTVPPELGVPGIWWDARVETVPEVFVADLSVRPRLDDDDARIDASLTVDTGRDVAERVRFSLRPEGFRGGGVMEQARVEASAGERTTVERSLEVRDPKLWWPREHGPQHRYTVRAKVGDHDATVTTGLRRVERDGETLLVNGTPVSARGFARLPGDPADEVARAVEANATLLRTRAHVAHPSLYEACDEAGVLVWQDLPLSGPGGYDADRAETLASALSGAVGHHPSLACATVHDDPVDLTRGLGDGWLDRLRFRWRARSPGYDRPPQAVVDAMPGVAFPVVGQPGTGADALALYEGAFAAPDGVEWLLGWRPELGGVVAGFSADAAPDERAQARKRVAERLRRHGSGLLATFALRDATDDDGPGVLARDGREKADYAAVADAFEPVQALLDDAPTAGGDVGVTVANDSSDAVAGTLSWMAGEDDGSASVEVAPRDRAATGSVSVPVGAETVTLELDLGGTTVTNEYRVG